MPTKRVADIATEAEPTHPVPSVEKCRARRKQALSDAVGLSQFGVNRVELDPDVWSTVRHWHTHEDEFVLILEGELTLVTNAGAETLRVGDVAGFPAGVPDGHRLENRSDSLAVYLEVGSRRPDVDEVDYSDEDLLIRQTADGRRVFTRRDGTELGEA
ncbi:MAG: cupin domain-containing protein [Pseudomonadota bacterium]